MRLFLVLAAVPIIEIALFIEVGGRIGTWSTIAIVILTALAGSILLRWQGLAALRSVRTRLVAGESPERLLAHGAMILIAGALLLTPGFFTDAAGFALLAPTVRDMVWRQMEKRIRVVSVQGDPEGPRRPSHGGRTVDGVYEDVTPATPPDGSDGPEEASNVRREASPRGL